MLLISVRKIPLGLERSRTCLCIYGKTQNFFLRGHEASLRLRSAEAGPDDVERPGLARAVTGLPTTAWIKPISTDFGNANRLQLDDNGAALSTHLRLRPSDGHSSRV